ncbi:MAG: hypothetical protein WAT66_03735, partial [Actinomycetota bacterium]
MRRPRSSTLRVLLVLCVVAASLALVPAGAQLTLRRPCDPLDAALCLLPFPNDRFTRPDPT